MSAQAVTTFSSHQDTQGGDTGFLHQVQFLQESFTISSPTFATQDGTIPEVGAYIFILLVTSVELSVLDGYKRRFGSLLLLAGAETEDTKQEC